MSYLFEIKSLLSGATMTLRFCTGLAFSNPLGILVAFAYRSIETPPIT